MANQEIDNITPDIQQLVWINKNAQQKVFANSKSSSSGALLVQQTIVTAGFPVEVSTLDGWMKKTDFDALRAHNAATLTSFVLKLNTDTLNVIWDNTNGPAITGDDLFVQVGGHEYLTNVTLKFLTV